MGELKVTPSSCGMGGTLRVTLIAVLIVSALNSPADADACSGPDDPVYNAVGDMVIIVGGETFYLVGGVGDDKGKSFVYQETNDVFNVQRGDVGVITEESGECWPHEGIPSDSLII